jgi:hypothetical protein
LFNMLIALSRISAAQNFFFHATPTEAEMTP